MRKIVPAFKNNNIPICLFSDDYYVPYLGTAVLSAIKNVAENSNLDILIFENGYTEKNKNLLCGLAKNNKNVSVRFIDMKPFIENLKVNPSKRVSVNCFAKIFCTDEMFCEYDKIIFLDSDLLILQDLKELYDTDLGNNMFAAVRELYVKIMVSKGYHTDARLNFQLLGDYLNEIGLEPDNYFNTGVIVFDVKKCQEARVQEKILEINSKYPTMMYAAQDDLNILFKNEWTELASKWNVQNPYGLIAHIDEFPTGYREFMEQAGILHFLGKSKPWDDKNVWKSELFDEYALQTPWKDEYLARRKKYEKRNRIKKRLIPKGSKRREIYLKLYFGISKLKANIVDINN